MECVKEGYNITLHVADLLVQNDTVEVEEVGGGDVEVFKLEYDTAREFLVIQLQVQYNLIRSMYYSTIQIIIQVIRKANDIKRP